MDEPLLQIKDLTVDFITDHSTTRALKNVALTVRRGETVAIVGESGSGKSVTALSILRLLAEPPAIYRSGGIWITTGEAPVNVLQASQEAITAVRGRKAAMIFQEPMSSLNPVLTCGEQVMETILLHRRMAKDAAVKKTLALFEKVQLPDPPRISRSYPHQVSGGQKQRVMIAMAMSCEPSLLVCDEPTTALDVTVQKSILQLIKSLQRQENIGVIFITHDLGVVAEIADRVVVLYKGTVVEENTMDRLLRMPKHPYTKALLLCRPALHAPGERLPVVSDFMQEDENGNILEKNAEQLPAGVTKKPPAGIAPKAATPAPLLRVQNLSVQFPGRKNAWGTPMEYNTAVNDVSFDVFPGETLGLVGESGCGKTTLGRTIARLISASAGKIWYKNENILQATPERLKELRKEIQIIFQDPYSSLQPRMSIGKAIEEPLFVHGLCGNTKQRKEKTVSLLEQVGLKADQYNRYPHEFSGGQRQRIVIARALALNPSFVICDESVSALDVSVQAQVLNLLNDLKAEFGFTSIFISHDLSVVRYISDRIMVMHEGKIEETGNAAEIYASPKTDYTKTLVNAMVRVPANQDMHRGR